MIYVLSRLICKVILKFFFRLEIIGKENIPGEGAFIIAANHKSFLDPVVIGAALPRKIWYIAKEDLFNNCFSSWYLSRLNVIPIKRDFGDFKGIKTALGYLRRSRPMLLFPEGTRVEAGDELQEPRRGMGLLAIKAKVPIIPAFIEGSDKALPRDAKFIRFHKIRVYFGKTIEKVNYLKEGRQAYQELTEEAMSCIRRLGCK